MAEPVQQDDFEAFVDSHRDVLQLLERVWAEENPESQADIGRARDHGATRTFSSTAKAAVELADEKESPAGGELPDTIGRFQIRELIGRGGFGLVFLAHDPRLKRDIALKIPRPEIAITDEARARFVREAETSASLNHASIVPVFEAGNYGMMCYIASSLCDGPTLTEWYRARKSLDPVEAVDLIIPICEAVQHAHSRGIMHRDLKPDNILVENASHGGSSPVRLLLTDFGLARSIDDSGEITREGSVIGTPSWMAPEQLCPSDEADGPACDIYSLGATLYFLLTGQPPLKGASLLETIRLVQEKTPSPPSARDARVPRDLDAICLKCLEKTPDRRYDAVSSLEADLLRFRAGMPVLAQSPSLIDRAMMWCRRKPAVAALGAALAGVLVVSTIVLGFALANTARLKTIADDHAARAIAEQRFTRAALDAMTSKTAAAFLAGQTELTPEQTTFLRQAVSWYEGFARNETGSDEERYWVAEAELQLARLLTMLGEHDEALAAIARATGEFAAISPQWNPAQRLAGWAEALLTKDELLERTGAVDEALQAAELAVEKSREALQHDPQHVEARKTLAKALGNAGTCLRRQQRLEEALARQLDSNLIKEQLALDDPADTEGQRQLGIGYLNVGNLLTQMDRRDERASTCTGRWRFVSRSPGRCLTRRTPVPMWVTRSTVWVDWPGGSNSTTMRATGCNRRWTCGGNWPSSFPCASIFRTISLSRCSTSP